MTDSQKPHKQIPKLMMTFNFGMTPTLVSNDHVVNANLKMCIIGFGFHCFVEQL